MSTQAGSQLSFVLRPDEGRGAPMNVVGEPTLVKVATEDSGGAIALFHLTAPPMSGPPLHVHSREDEVFYVLEGELIFEVNGVRDTVGPGGTVYLKRGIPHRYQNLTKHDARLLIAVTPGAFQNFFGELSDATLAAGGGIPPLDVLAGLGGRHGIEFLGPPILE